MIGSLIGFDDEASGELIGIDDGDDVFHFVETVYSL
jgi:hypothetical protein